MDEFQATTGHDSTITSGRHADPSGVQRSSVPSVYVARYQIRNLDVPVKFVHRMLRWVATGASRNAPRVGRQTEELEKVRAGSDTEQETPCQTGTRIEDNSTFHALPGKATQSMIFAEDKTVS
jgi:hypothetical protein